MLTQWTTDAEMLYRGEGTEEQGYRTTGGGTHKRTSEGSVAGSIGQKLTFLSLISVQSVCEHVCQQP